MMDPLACPVRRTAGHRKGRTKRRVHFTPEDFGAAVDYVSFFALFVPFRGYSHGVDRIGLASEAALHGLAFQAARR